MIKMRIQYGDCQPGAVDEAKFDLELSQATSTEGKELAKAFFKEQIDRCKGFNTDKGICENNGCKWS